MLEDTTITDTQQENNTQTTTQIEAKELEVYVREKYLDLPKKQVVNGGMFKGIQH